MSRLWVAWLVVWLAPWSLAAKTIRVPSDVSTIGQAVAESAEGDTVSVAPGTYLDRFTLLDKNIVLRGEMGADATVIDGSIGMGNVITVASTVNHVVNRSTVIEGLTIRGGSFNTVAAESTGAAIYVNRSNPTIRACRLTENDGNAAGGVVAYFFSQPLIEDCWVAYNPSGGIYIETDTGVPGPAAEIRNTFIVRNEGSGVIVIKGARANIQSCTIAYNAGSGILGEITQFTTNSKCYVSVEKSLVTHNSSGGIAAGPTRGICYSLECNDVFANAAGDYVRCSVGDNCFDCRGPGDVSIDPLYRNAASDDFHLSDESPLYSLCIPGSCGAMGAESACVAAAQVMSWGAVKQLYR